MPRKLSLQSPSLSSTGTTDRPAPYRLPTLASTDPTASSVLEPSPTGGPNGKKRRLSKVMAATQLPPRSGFPTMTESELERKRNKLGYQRISIACAHCRRRKIRCLVAEGDPQGRCQNCIRLKKECVFYPVDQQGAMDDRSQAPSQTPAGSGGDSVDSSSPSASERPFEGAGDFHGFQIAPGASGSFQSLDMVTGIPGVFPSPGDFSDPSLVYTSQSESRPPWGAPSGYNGTPSSTGMPPPAHGAFWRGPTHPAPGSDFTPFPSSSPQQQYSQNTYAPSMDYMQRGAHGWPPPPPPVTRSMSYGIIESLPMNAPQSFGGPTAHEPPRRPSPMRYAPSPLDVRSISAMQHETGPRSAPIAAHPPPFGQPTSYMYHNSPAQHPVPATPWYHANTPYGDVDHAGSSHGPHGQYQSVPRHSS